MREHELIEEKSKVESRKSKARIRWFLGFLFLALNCQLSTVDCFPATKIFLHDAISPLSTQAAGGAGYGCANGSQEHVYRTATTTQGSSAVTKTFAPISTAPPCLPQTATSSGQFLRFISPPISSAVTVDANVNFQAGCAESAAQLNGGFRFRLYRWRAAVGGVTTLMYTSGNSTECTTGGSNLAIAAADPPATSLSVGDRIVIEVQVMNVGTWGGNSTRTFSLVYDAGTGVYGDSFANFVDNISFAGDTNNARAVVQ